MNNITIFRSGAIGDFVLALPAINAIHKAFPDKSLRIVGPPATTALYRAADHLNHEDQRLIALHREGPIPEETRALFAHTERVMAYAVDREGCLQQQLNQIVDGPVQLWDPRPPDGFAGHIVDHLLRPLQQWSIPVDAPIPRIDLTPAPEDSAPRDIILHPGSGSPAKNWPETNYRALATELEQRGWHPALLCGPVEAERGLDINLATVRPPDLPALAHLLAGARLFIGNDSGPGHIAAAVGTPTLSLFGPTDPRVWAPRHPAGRVVESPSGDIVDIPLTAVVESARQMLEGDSRVR